LLDNIDKKDLIKKHRDLADRLIALSETIAPYLNEYEKMRSEFIEVCEAIEERMEKEESNGKSISSDS
jgi:hypothetical protein